MTAKFRIHHIHINTQRNKSDPDADLVNFQVGTTHNFTADDFAFDTNLDPLNRREVLGVSVGTPSSGAEIGPPLDPPIETGELVFTEADDIVMTCHMSNGSHSDGAAHFSNLLKIGGAVAAAIGGGIELAEKLKRLKLTSQLEIALEDGTILGLLAALAGEFLSDYGVSLGLVEPDCDGPVFDSITSNQIVKLSGSVFADAIANGQLRIGQEIALGRLTDASQVGQTHCQNPSTTIFLSATLTSADPITLFGRAAGPAVRFVPAVGRIPDVWVNTWGDHDTIEGSTLQCTIAKSSLAQLASGSSGDVVQAKLALVPSIADLIGDSPRAAGKGPTTELPSSMLSPGSNVAAGNKAIATIAEHVLQVTVVERESVTGGGGTQLSNVTSGAAFSIPMNTSAFRGNTFALSLAGFQHHPFQFTTNAPAAVAVAASVAGSGTAVSHVGDQPIFADSVALSGGVTLQLYNAYDANNLFAGTRLRYHRIGSTTAFSDTDVMLQPAQPVPK
jgi:hypothetical protein